MKKRFGDEYDGPSELKKQIVQTINFNDNTDCVNGVYELGENDYVEVGDAICEEEQKFHD